MKVLVVSGDPAFKEGNERYELHKQALGHLDVFRYQGILAGPIGFFQIVFVALSTKYDVIVSQEPFWRGLLAWFAARLSGARLNVQVHVEIRAQSVMKQRIAQFVLRRADSVRVVSNKLKQEMGKFGVTAPIYALPTYLDLKRFSSIKRRPSQRPTVLWVGRFEDEKDPLLAVEVFKKVRESLPSAHMIMLGTGSLEGKLKQKAKEIPIEFPGWSDPVPYLARAHAVLSTSPAESWGASIVEALAASVSVVSMDVGVAKEAGAIVVEKDQLADAVIKVLQNPPHAKLKLTILSKEDWITAWRTSLV